MQAGWFNGFVVSVLERLYRARLWLLGVVVTVAGLGLLELGHIVRGSGWLSVLPVTELGATLTATGLLAVFFEFVIRKLNEERIADLLRSVVHDETAALAGTVVDAVAAPVEVLRTLPVERLHSLAVDVLAVVLRDRELAAEIFSDVQQQVLAAPERWRNVAATVDLSPWDGGPVTGVGAMFVATVRWEYKVVPSLSELRCVAVSDPDEYRRLLRDPAVTSVWLVGEASTLHAGARESFELVQVTVDDQACPIRHTERAGSQLYTAALPTGGPGREVTVAYTYRALVQQLGHAVFINIPRPARGLRVRMNYSRTGIRQATVWDFITSAHNPRVTVSPSTVPTRSVDVGFDGWVFPRAGIVLSWVLDTEVTPEPLPA